MRQKSTLREINGVLYFTVTKPMREHLNLGNTREIEWEDDIGKHGNFISFWNVDQHKEKSMDDIKNHLEKKYPQIIEEPRQTICGYDYNKTSEE